MTTIDTQDQLHSEFEKLLEESAIAHGHCCPGQVLGVKMALLGLKEVGISDPKSRQRKDIIIYVEMDRCASDAVQSVTGCSLGRRTLKFLDYGKMAATFVNLKTGAAVRVIAREAAREKARELFPDIEDAARAQLEAYKVMTNEDLFEIMPNVRVALRPEDMPGRPLSRVRCTKCGEYVQDMREVYCDGKALCRPCADGGYYQTQNVFRRSVMQKSHNGLEIRSKVWIEAKGEPVFGRGRRFLLEAIDAHGSINRAAREVNISYRKAWSHIKAMEERLGMRLVERQTGGKNGGGAVLTGGAREFLRRFEHMEDGLREVVDRKFEEIFGSGVQLISVLGKERRHVRYPRG
jgi:molybdate transport repressor ModE-like protein